MTQPKAPAEPTTDTDEVFLGTGAYGDPTQPDQSRKVYEETQHPETGPTNPSSDPVPVSGPGGTEPAPTATDPAAPADPAPAQ